MTDLEEQRLEAAKRRIRAPEGFTPEHSGLSDRGVPLSLAEAMPGGAVVTNKTQLKAQSEPDYEEMNILAADYDATMLQRRAAEELAQEDQDAAEKQAEADDKAQAQADKAAVAEAKKAQPVKIVEDKTTA